MKHEGVTVREGEKFSAKLCSAGASHSHSEIGYQSSSMFSIAPERLLDTILAKSQNVVNRKVGDYLPLTDCELHRTCLSVVEKDLRCAHKKFVRIMQKKINEFNILNKKKISQYSKIVILF